jgi:hypothetical protein
MVLFVNRGDSAIFHQGIQDNHLAKFVLHIPIKEPESLSRVEIGKSELPTKSPDEVKFMPSHHLFGSSRLDASGLCMSTVRRHLLADNCIRKPEEKASYYIDP